MAHAGGRPTLYKSEYCQKIIEFFDIEPSFTREIVTTGKNDYCKTETIDVPNALPHIVDFAKKIHVTTFTIYEWAKKHQEFSNALKEVKLFREKIIEANALRGLYSNAFAIFDAKNTLGWRDEQYLKGEGFTNIMQIVVSKNVKPKNPHNRLISTDAKI